MMDIDKDDPIVRDVLSKELVVSLPFLSKADVELILNGFNSSSEDSASEDEKKEKEKPCHKRDQRRLNLLNNPDYGLILCFLTNFRAHLSVKHYPLRVFEDNVLNESEKVSQRFIDFHLALLKKLSPGKNFERTKFLMDITRFASRYSPEDGKHLEQHGYSKAKVDVKLRILKNLLENQFDHNQTLKNAVLNKPSSEIRSKPFGRDRFGGFYWLFMESDSFIRIFREHPDVDRTWRNVAKNQQEFENLIKILITDSIVRKKFSDWKISYESFDSLPLSNQFEQQFSKLSSSPDIKKKINTVDTLIRYHSRLIKADNVDFQPVVNLNRNLPISPEREEKNAEVPIDDTENEDSGACYDNGNDDDDDSINSVEINPRRVSISSSSGTRDEISSYCSTQEYNKNYQQIKAIEESIRKIREQHLASIKNNDDSQVVLLKPSTNQGTKLKLVDYDDSEGDCNTNESKDNNDTHSNVEVNHESDHVVNEVEEHKKHDETSQESRQTTSCHVPINNNDLPIALRRSKRGSQLSFAALSPSSSTTSRSNSCNSKRSKSTNGRSRNSSQSRKINAQQRRNQSRRGKSSKNDRSSTTSEENQISDDLSEDYLADDNEFDEFLSGDIVEEDNDNDANDNTKCRRAKTVAECYEQLKKPCFVCSSPNRPEVLLLCEYCNDAYHLECIKPALISIPDDEWNCPLCEHKQLCDDLISKLYLFIKNQEEHKMRRRLMISKRKNPTQNLTINIDRYVQNKSEVKPIKSTPSNIPNINDDSESNTIPYNDENNNNTMNNKDDDVDSVYGSKNDENRKPTDDKTDESGKPRVRSCRKKAQSYSLDDFDKKFKEALVDIDNDKKEANNDTDESDDKNSKKKSSKKRSRFQIDEDFDSLNNNDDDYVPFHPRSVHGNSRSEARDDDRDPFGMSDNDSISGNRRQSTTSSSSKKKAKPKANRTNRRKSTIRSEEDSIASGTNVSTVSSVTTTIPLIKVKSEPITEFSANDPVNNLINKTEAAKTQIQYAFNASQFFKRITIDDDEKKSEPPKKPARPKRTSNTQNKASIEEENVSDNEDDDKPLLKHVRTKRRFDSDEQETSPGGHADDYEKVVHKRRLLNHGKNIVRRSITSHIQRLVGEEEDDENNEQDQSGKDKNADDNNNNTKQVDKKSTDDPLRLSDDDDFPDEQEILKTTKIRSTGLARKAQQQNPFQSSFMSAMPSYQFSMVDPTALFDLSCQDETPIAQPSEPMSINGDS